MPTLEMVNDRFARLFRISLFNHAAPDTRDHGDADPDGEVRRLHAFAAVPTNLNLVKIMPLRGTGLFVLDPKLVFAIGRQLLRRQRPLRQDRRPRVHRHRNRIIHMVLKYAFADLKEAWSHVARLDIEYLSSEINPHFAGIVSPTEIVVVSPFQIELDGGGGACTSRCRTRWSSRCANCSTPACKRSRRA